MTSASRFYPLPGLQRQLKNITELPLSILLAPMGFGKTASMQAYLEESGNAYAQLRLTEPQTDPSMIWKCYQRSLQRELPALAGIFEGTDPPTDSASRAHIVNALEDSVSSTTILVFDDYQNVASPAIHKLIEVLARQNIPCLHIVLLSRSRPPIGCIDELRLKGLCQILGKHLFCFQEADIMAYFKKNGAPITAPEAAALYIYSEGWVAVLHFALLGVLSNGKLDYTMNLHGLLHQVLCESCSKEEAALLYQLSHYHEFSALHAEHLVQAAGIGELLERLSADCALLTYDRQRGLFVWNELMRSYLQTQSSFFPQHETADNNALLPFQTPGINVKIPSHLQLSAREIEVLTLLCSGMRRAAIAKALNISLSSVKKNIENMYVKLQVNNVAAAVNIARESGLVTQPLIQAQDPHIRKDLLSQQ